MSKTQQQKDGENIFRRFFNMFITGSIDIRSSTITPDMSNKEQGRLTIFFKRKEKKNDK